MENKDQEEHIIKLKEIDNLVKKKVSSYILYIKQRLSFSLNSKTIQLIRKAKEEEVILNVIYYGENNEIIHALRNQCYNIINALNLLYTLNEHQSLHTEDDYSLCFHELFNNIKDKENLFKIKNIEFSLELKKNYKFI